MGKTVALDARTLDHVRRHFRAYYAATPVDPPLRFARREFAAFPFTEETQMRRHTSFDSSDAFHGFLRREVPRHVYYSSAYYRTPDHPTMAQKEWLGADLIFDLDADHLRGAEQLDYPGQLARVKERVRDLFDEFLVGDFGLDPAEMRLVFSGGRGYHIHVTDPAYQSLSSPERRELVDYVQGTGVDPSAGFQDGPALTTSDAPGDDAPRGGRRTGSVGRKGRLVPRDAPGWPGRTSRAFLDLLARWDEQGPDAAARELKAMGIAPLRAKNLAASLVTEGRGRQIRETGSLDVFPGKIPEELSEAIFQGAKVAVQGETDAPVTTDIHRLIRLPGSLHGGTGFRVTPVPRAALDAFDPWRDAVPPVANGGGGTVELTVEVDYPFAAGRVAGPAGATLSVGAVEGAFLLLRGEARLPPGPG